MKHHHYVYHVWLDFKKGYDNYSWVFFIGAIGTIIATDLKITGGVAAVLIAFAAFYLAGRFHTRIEKAFKERRKRDKRNRK